MPDIITLPQPTPSGPRPPTRRTRSGILFIENARHPMLGMTNDGIGAVYRDNEIPLGDNASIRLDPQGLTTANTNPGNNMDNSGVVLKRRLMNNALNPPAAYAWEGWFRWTSNGNQANQQTSCSIYNRDGTTQSMGRLWFDCTIGGGTSTLVSYQDQNNVWQPATTYGFAEGDQHTYDYLHTPTSVDIAGGWHYFRLEIDLALLQYRSCQFNEALVDLRGKPLFQVASAAPTMLHFSFEYAQRTSFRRYINIAQLVGEQMP